MDSYITAYLEVEQLLIGRFEKGEDIKIQLVYNEIKNDL